MIADTHMLMDNGRNDDLRRVISDGATGSSCIWKLNCLKEIERIQRGRELWTIEI